METIIQEIALSKLVPSEANVRRTNRTQGVEELAASIAAHGLLQNLTVRRGKKANGKAASFEVIGGGRRLAALRLLVQRKALAKDAPIPCHVIEGGIAEEISLAENALQCPMHPADQFEAFSKLHTEHGMNAEDIAARFGVTAAVVRQRLKLGAVSPVLMQVYRDGDMDLDQLSAFTITADHAEQERVWEALPAYNRDRHVILRMLNESHVASDDRRARFVGAEAYEAAGGAFLRDLFDEEGGGFFADAALLTRLVAEKLESVAGAVRAEGWTWVRIEPEFDHSLTADMRRVYPERPDLTEAQQAEYDAIEVEYEAIRDSFEGEETAEADAEIERLENALAALTGEDRYLPEQLAVAGAFVSLGYDGEPRIERGFIRPEDASSSVGVDASGDGAGGGRQKAPSGLSDKLTAELTAHLTAGLRDQVAQQPDLALLALVHALAASTFYHRGGISCLRIAAQSVGLSVHAPGIDESLAGRSIAERHEAWAARMPEEGAALWDFVVALREDERMALLAHCVSLTVDAMQVPHPREAQAVEHAQEVSRAARLDMTVYWQATAASYFGRVSKERIAQVVREGVSIQAAENAAKLKKDAMAEAAERQLAGRWLPELLRRQE